METEQAQEYEKRNGKDERGIEKKNEEKKRQRYMNKI